MQTVHEIEVKIIAPPKMILSGNSYPLNRQGFCNMKGVYLGK